MNEHWLLSKHSREVVPGQILCLRRSTWILVAAGKEDVAWKSYLQPLGSLVIFLKQGMPWQMK